MKFRIEDISVKELVTDASVGSDIGDCVISAIKLSLDFGADVKLRHNEKEYYINHRDVSRFVYEIVDNGGER